MRSLRHTCIIINMIVSVLAWLSTDFYLLLLFITNPVTIKLQRTESAAFALHRWAGGRTVLRGRPDPRLVRSIPISTRGCNPCRWLPWKLPSFSIHVQVSTLYPVRVSHNKRNARFRYFEIRKSSILLFHQIKHCLLKRFDLIWFGSIDSKTISWIQSFTNFFKCARAIYGGYGSP